MAQRTAIRLSGEGLTVADGWTVAVGGAAAELSDEARLKMRSARELVERAAHGTREHTYGVNTGFGRFVSRSIPEELTEELQLRLLRSHACGVGDPYPDDVVRAAMLLRANTLAKGNSGARVETVELLLECLNRGVLPVVPARGSVGASGDLAPLAHLALPLVRARRLARASDCACALSLEALQGSQTSFLPQVHALRPLRGQALAAANVLRLLEGPAINEAHRWCDKVQDAYSLRCAPQVHG